MKFRSFHAVVSDICAIAFDDDTGKNRSRVSRSLINVMAEMNMHMLTPVKSAFVTITSNFTASLPSGASSVTKVGVMCGSNLKLISRNENVYRPETPICSCSTSASSGESCSACTFHNVMQGNVYGEAYGYRPDPWANGEYRYDEFSNTLQFSSGSDIFEGQEVLVEYKCVDAPESLNLIPASLVNMLIFRVSQVLNLTSKPGVSQLSGREFERSYQAAIRAWNQYTPEDLISALMGENMSAPK